MKIFSLCSLALIALVAIILCGANLYLGDLNQDEGWYLYAARSVSEGRLPYRDFAFTQAPLLPLVYSALWPQKYGVAGGRLVTALLGLGSAIAVAALAWRLAGKNRRWPAALLVLCFVSINSYQSYFTTIVKTYSLCAFCLAIGFLFLTWLNTRWGRLSVFIAGLFLALAAATRISVIIALPVVFVGLLFARRFDKAVTLAVGAGLVGVGIMLPLFLASPDSFIFALWSFHTARQPGSFLYSLVLKAGSLSRIIQAYYPAVAALTVLLVLKVWANKFGLPSLLRRGRTAARRWGADESIFVLPCLWWTVGLVTIAHLAAPFPYDDYQTVVYPLFVAALVLASLDWLPADNRGKMAVVVVAFLVTTAAAVASPLNQDWLIRGRDRVWWRMKEKPDLRLLQDFGAYLKTITKPGDSILTQDAYLAVESGLSLPSGLELGPFCYYPDLGREEALRRRVVNKELLLELIAAARPSVAAVSGYTFTIASPAVSELPMAETAEFLKVLQRGYSLKKTVPFFGQGHTSLGIYVLAGAAEAAGSGAK